ncbi:MAG: transglycosylase domain-containing protein [Microcystaceae cyanobacterium]
MANNSKKSLKQRFGEVLHSFADKLAENETHSPNEAEKSVSTAQTAPHETVQPEVSDADSSHKNTKRRQLQRKRRRRVAQRKFVKKVSHSVQHTSQRLYRITQRPRFWLWTGLGLGITSSAVGLGWGIYQLESNLPESVEDVLTYAPEGTITIKGSNGDVLQAIGPITYDPLKIWQIPDPVLQAFIASEDRRFESHHGIDIQGILRAAWVNVRAGGVVEGGSTITQQLARIVFLSQERSLNRKVREMRIAQKLEGKLTKSQILERYLNLVYLGSGAYGLGDAAWIYFGKTVDQLTIGEAATLAGIIPAPSTYSPIDNPEAAKERRNLVLNQMADLGMITPEEAKTTITSPLTLNAKKPKRLVRQAPHFTDYVMKEVGKYVSRKVLDDGGVVIETTLDPKWQQEAEETIENGVKRYGRGYRFQQASLVSVDPRTGQIKAMVGGVDYENNQFNRAVQAKRQPGSTFKTFVYATAIAAGFSPNQGFLDAEYVVDGYKPENYGDKYSGNTVSMRQALASSLNVVAVKVLVDVGWTPIIGISRKMGIESELKPTYSLALGSWEVDLLELTGAYGTLANNGLHQQPYGISRVLDRNGNVLYQAKPQTVEALDPESTAITTWMLRGVVSSGTGRPAQIGRPVAGKTGTSDKARDLWFVGYIPQLVTGIWLGNDNNQPTRGASSLSAMLWRQYMLEVIPDIPSEGFPAIPSKLHGRQPTVKKEPIKPKRAYYNRPKTTQATSRSSSGSSSSTRRRSTRRRSQPQPQARSRSTRSYSRPAPQRQVRQSAPPPARPKTTAPKPAPAAPVAAPSGNTAPPAPPAARKTE